ncbi:MAG: cytochrome-c peroxidase, partial [Bdellovibrionales bacterium]|nr:cytochrome-c peroxidase [Bdellovibrionales bacterium]
MPKRKARSNLWTSLIALSVFVLVGCNASSTFKSSPTLQSKNESAVKLEAVPFPLPPELATLKPQIPTDSPLTEDRIALGEKLFSDTRLSRDQSMSCMGCHQPALSFTAPIVTGRLRNPPVIFNRL